MKFDFLHIDQKHDLTPHIYSIRKLFEECFNRTLSEKQYQWAYLDNPLGNPLVNLVFLDHQLVGHYAFVPIPTTRGRALLSITTMVAKSVRRYSVFYDLALRSYDFAKQKKYDYIMGFPNKNAVKVHEQLLNWVVLPTFIAQTPYPPKPIFPLADYIALDLEYPSYLSYRLSKPDIHYIQEGKNIFKQYSHQEIDCLITREKNTSHQKFLYNFLTQDKSLLSHKILDYPFAYKILSPQTSTLSFFPELLMSDVF